MSEVQAGQETTRRDSGIPSMAPADLSNAIYHGLRRSILFAAGLILLWNMAGPIGAILLLFLLVFIIAAVLNPAVARMERWGMPRILSAIILVLLLVGALVLVMWLAVPPLLKEVGAVFGRTNFSELHLSTYYEDFRRRYPEVAAQLPPPQDLFQRFTPNVGALLGRVGGYAMNVVSLLFTLLLLMVLVIYTVGKPEPLIAGYLSAWPERHRPRADAWLRRSMTQLKYWGSGSIILGGIVGALTAVGLWIVGVPYVMLFAVIAAIGELLPTIGPILSAIPPVLVALTIDPMMAVWVLVVCLIVQQLENNLIVPMVYGRTLDLHPVSVMFAVLAMGSLFGFLGALLAVPVTVLVKAAWEEFYLKPRHTDMVALEATAGSIAADGEGTAAAPAAATAAAGKEAADTGDGSQRPKA